MAKLACPYCFTRIRRRRLLFRCIGGGPGRTGGCEPVLDTRYQAYVGDAAAAVLPPVFAADGRKPRAVHEACGQVSQRRVCPECHNELPGDYCDVRSRLLVLVGAKNSGKSTYIAVLLYQLLNNLGKELGGASVTFCDDRTRRRYREDFERPLLYRRELLPVTPSAATGLREPLLFRLTIPRRVAGLSLRRSLTLVLFDTAGEDLTSEESASRHVAYLRIADAVLVLVDPLELPGAQPDVAVPPVSQAGAGDDPVDVVQRVLTYLRRAHRVGPNGLLRVPVAVALTKTDALRTDPSAQSLLDLPPPRSGRLDLADREAVDTHVRGLLERWGAGALDRGLAHSVRTRALFGLTALGHPPKGGTVNPAGISPHRVEDPLLWLLHRFRMVPATKPPTQQSAWR